MTKTKSSNLPVIKQTYETVKKIPRGFLQLLLPLRCVMCREAIHEDSVKGLCGTCWQTMTFLGDACCTSCGLPFDIVPETSQICARCLQKPPPFSTACAAVLYDDISKDLILSFKHGDATQLAPVFGNWMFQAVKRKEINQGLSILAKTDFFVPVPLHRLRLMKRGYNQASLLSNSLSRLTGIPTHHNLLIRNHNTQSQGHLSHHDRHENVKNKFTVLTKNQSKIKKKVITLIDDVFTSGATVTACADVLHKAGAQEICVLTLARVAHL